MNDEEVSLDALSEEESNRIDALCQEFEQAWPTDTKRSIEQLLERSPELPHNALLRQLIRLEMDLCLESGESIKLDQYQQRFPSDELLVTRVWLAKNANSERPDDPSSLISRENLKSPKPDARNERTELESHSPGAQPPVSVSTKLKQKTTLENSVDFKTPPDEFGRYQILRELGRGGMGAVYLARDRQLERKVALKIPHFRDNDSETVERFYREARAMATVQHPNLCPVFDVGRHEEWHFLTMAFIEGQSLSQKLKVEAPIAVVNALGLLKKLAMALHKAHEAGIVHRDLKPANIMLSLENEPFIMDFGLARRRVAGEVDLTHSGVVFGTPAYMAPEQVEARHDEIGPATDVYALGVILYQTVTGRRPFEGSVASIFGQIVSQTPAPPSRIRRELPLELDAICQKALAKSPLERHGSAAKFAEEITSLSASLQQPDRNKPATVTYRLEVNSENEFPAINGIDEPLSGRSRREAELRHVTVAIFNYETEYGGLSASHSNSEFLQQQSNSFSAYVREHVAKLGGVIAPGTGSEVVACFGFPQAFEDAPQRAVRSALQFQRDLAPRDLQKDNLPAPNQVWVILHSGEVVAEELSTEPGSGISLVGEARNTALRLNAVVDPGIIALSPATYQRVSLYFECQSLGAQRVRGISQPVELFRVIKEATARNRVDLVDPGNLTPLVGRDTELSILKDRWEQALDHLGQVVLLIGDAGLGKSRLIRELREHVIGEDIESAAVIEWRCSQYYQGTSFYPIVEFFGRLLNFENLSASERLDRVIRYLNELNLESVENVSLMCLLLGVPMGERFRAASLAPTKIKDLTEELLLKWLKQLVTISPVLFIVEDLHWLDPSTLELLEKHVLEFESGRILSVLTFRPEFETPWKSKPHQTQIALNRLTKRQIGEMMLKRTNRKVLPDAIVQQVIARTDGIPLFIEEFTAVIVESGILDRTDAGADAASLLNVIPVTLQDLLLSRLDRMGANRDVVQQASTIGREFDFRLLFDSSSLPAEKLQLELDKLVKAEILFRKGHSNEASYIFKHALLQDGAYRSMLTKTRQGCHQRIADALEAKFPEICTSQPALLAQHFGKAGLVEKSAQYWLKAGQLSQEQSANVEAVQQLENGLALAMSLPSSQDRDMLELAFKLRLSAVLMAVQGYAAPQVESVQNRCIEICRSLGDRASLFQLQLANWVWLFVRGRFHDCYERCAEVIATAEKSTQRGIMAEAQWTYSCTAFYAGDFPGTREHSEIGWNNYDRDASIEYSKITQQNSGPLNQSQLGLALWQLGFADRGISLIYNALNLSYDLKHVFTQVVIEWMVSQVHGFAGIGSKAVEFGERCRRIADEQAFMFWVGMGNGCKGIGLKHLGRFDEAIETLELAIGQMGATGAAICRSKYKGHLADSLWQAGRRDAAITMLDEAFSCQSDGEYFMHAELLRIRGDFQFDLGHFDEAETWYRKSIDVAVGQKARFYELRSTLHLSRIWKHRGQIEDIRSHLKRLESGFTEGFDMPDLKETKAILAGLE